MHRVAVIVLAAGRSTRFAGSNTSKLLALLDGTTIVRRAVQAAIAAGVGDVVVVTGADANAVNAEVADLAVRTVHADDYADGMSASLRRGVESVGAVADAVIVALADQPTIRPQAFRRVVSTWIATSAAIVIPRYASSSVPSHPTLFSSAVFGELAELRGDVGARLVIARDPDRVGIASIDWPAPRDVDTVNDLALVGAELHDVEHSDPEQSHRTQLPNSSSRS
jgi:molybdenum cofactor cytidylyltransferase